jgi:DNA-binding NarL/FixJ family response regulator
MDATEALGELETTDPREGLRSVVALRRLAERLEALHVARARAAGLSWAQIAIELQVTKQTVHKKYVSRAGRPNRGRRDVDQG